MSLKEILNFSLIETDNFNLTVIDLVIIAGISFAAYLLIFLIKKALLNTKSKLYLTNGSGHAVFQILKYFIIVITVVVILETIGVNVTLLLAGSAALLVGLGLGIKELFYDIISGFILLFERTITIDDIVEVDGMVAKVRKMSLRTSEVETRDDIIIIVPNSKLVSEKVINWSHNKNFTRFKIDVGVAYGSDVNEVISILRKCTESHPNVSTQKPPKIRFIDFGDSSLKFEVLFWSDKMFRIEDVKSDIRIMISKSFKENNIQIPFPQRDLHLKSIPDEFNVYKK